MLFKNAQIIWIRFPNNKSQDSNVDRILHVRCILPDLYENVTEGTQLTLTPNFPENLLDFSVETAYLSNFCVIS